MQNKILNKYLRQYYIGGALFFGIAAGSGIIMHKNAQLHEKDKIAFQDTEYDTTDPFQILSLLLISVCIYMGSQSVATIHNTKYRANRLAKLNLIDFFTKHPELRKYDHILQDDEKVNAIAAFACNNLSDTEQQKIIDIIDSIYSTKHKDAKEENIIIEKAHKEISKIILNHAQMYPAYALQILALIKDVKKTYVFNPNEHVR